MKKIYTSILGVALAAATFAQGQIMGFTVDPASPSTTDFVRIYVDLEFSSTGCAVDSQGHSTSGSTTNASAHHCLGMLSAICNTVDTFDLGFLPAGPHLFALTLSSGFGGPPCSPGIVPDDNDQVSFTVNMPTSIPVLENDASLLSFYPNPVNGTATVRLPALPPGNEPVIRIMDVTGRLLKSILLHAEETLIHLEELPAGIYFYQLNNIRGKFIVE